MLRPMILKRDARFVVESVHCPFCGLPFYPDDSVVECPSCKTPHHSKCWQDMGNRCSTLGCNGEGEVDLDALSPTDLIQILDSEIPQESPEVKPSYEQPAILASDFAAPTALEHIRSEQLPLELSKVNKLGQRTKALRITILLPVGFVLALVAAGIFLQIRVKPLPIEPSSLAWISIYLALGFLGGAVLGAIIGHTSTDASRTHD